MKYLLLTIAFLMFAQPALAAKSIKGTVPKVQPLQPLPDDAGANVQHNIQYSDPSHPPQLSPASGININQSGADQSQSSQNSPTEIPGQSKTKPAFGNWLVWLFLLIFLLGGVWLLWRFAQKDSKP